MQPPRQPEGLPLAIGCKFTLPHMAEHRRQVLEYLQIFRMPLQQLAHQTRGPGQIPQFKDVVDQPRSPQDCRLLAPLRPELLGHAIPHRRPADLAGIGPG